MKKLAKILFSLVLCCMLVLSVPATALAADPTIHFEGQDTGFSFAPGSEYSPSDLFGNFKNVMPGDKLSEVITVTNKADDSDYVKLYLKAIAHDEKGNPLTYSETFENTDGNDQVKVDGKRDETVVTMLDFLAQLTMRIYNGKDLIYEASPDELGALAEYILLAELRSGESITLTVELDVPIELGNEYANRVGEVDWVIMAEAFDDPEPTPETSPEPSQPNTDPANPSAPKTGDNTNVTLYLVLTGVSVLALIVLLVLKRKKDNNEA